MKTNLIIEIWEIKTIINEAIEKQDSQLFDIARKRFEKLYETKAYINSVATSTIDYEPENVEYMMMDREQNFAVIAFEFHKDSKRVLGEDVPIEQFQFSSMFELMWWNCWMFNNFVKNAEENFDIRQNMMIFNSIDHNMREMINHYENFEDINSKQERESLIKIHNMIKSKYNELYNNIKK